MKKHVTPLCFLLLLLLASRAVIAVNPHVPNPLANPSPPDPVMITVNTWVYLEGAMKSLEGNGEYSLPMRTGYFDSRILPGQTYENFMMGLVYAPPGQPYNIPPWNYAGTEGSRNDSGGNPDPGTAGYTETVVDWVLVSLRAEADGGALCEKAGWLHNDGHVEFIDGPFSCPELAGIEAFYLVIQHRNHLIIMTPTAVPVENNTLTFDFRYNQSYIDDPFGFGGSGQKELLPSMPGNFAMYSGNGCQVQYIYSEFDMNYDDRYYWETQNGSVASYGSADYNANGDCNYDDRYSWEVNNGIFTTVP